MGSGILCRVHNYTWPSHVNDIHAFTLIHGFHDKLTQSIKTILWKPIFIKFLTYNFQKKKLLFIIVDEFFSQSRESVKSLWMWRRRQSFDFDLVIEEWTEVRIVEKVISDVAEFTGNVKKRRRNWCTVGNILSFIFYWNLQNWFQITVTKLVRGLRKKWRGYSPHCPLFYPPLYKWTPTPIT